MRRLLTIAFTMMATGVATASDPATWVPVPQHAVDIFSGFSARYSPSELYRQQRIPPGTVRDPAVPGSCVPCDGGLGNSHDWVFHHSSDLGAIDFQSSRNFEGYARFCNGPKNELDNGFSKSYPANGFPGMPNGRRAWREWGAWKLMSSSGIAALLGASIESNMQFWNVTEPRCIEDSTATHWTHGAYDDLGNIKVWEGIKRLLKWELQDFNDFRSSVLPHVRDALDDFHSGYDIAAHDWSGKQGHWATVYILRHIYSAMVSSHPIGKDVEDVRMTYKSSTMELVHDAMVGALFMHLSVEDPNGPAIIDTWARADGIMAINPETGSLEFIKALPDPGPSGRDAVWPNPFLMVNSMVCNETFKCGIVVNEDRTWGGLKGEWIAPD